LKGLVVCSRPDWQLAASALASRLPEPLNDGHGKTRAAFYMASHGHFSAVSGAVRVSQSIYERCILSLLEPDEVVVDRLNDFQPHQLHGYAGSIHRLAGLALAGALRIAPKRIFVGGEPLTPAMERRITDAWAAPVYESYSAAESKTIAHRQSGRTEMSVVDELNLLEVLDEANRPVTGPGTGRAVLTNLFNTTLPLIRYELGDVIACGPGTADSPFKTIAIVAGKVLDALPISLRDGTPAAIDGLSLRSLFSVRGLNTIQFVSRPDRVRIVYVGEDNLDEVICQQFQRLLDGRGAATTIETERVAHIPVDPRTGKHRQVVEEG
jgi:phenylacetate-CoA ligase